MALQNWAIGYAAAARSRDAACGAVRSFYRWAQTPAAEGGPALVPPGTAKSLQFQRGGNSAAGLPGRELLTPDQCRWLAQAADRYPAYAVKAPIRPRPGLPLPQPLPRGPRPRGRRPATWADHRHASERPPPRAAPTWDVPQKNAASDATRLQPVHHDAVRAIDEYLPHRATTRNDTGHLFTTINGRPLEPQSLIRILRTVAATHPDLEEAAPRLSADAVTHSPPAQSAA
ncbi:hypothetical protein ADK90_38270 [Streptomyces sp. XY413]|uniref:hypothetical protein n=1 Tax=Streptomyces sp. XY413 TaxID=1519479 RepID=UPI0006AD923F|nr:hypothetical protein [Streptomyces sp. XY413]KOV13347.1 hypothetical protein ADK90_38270 [Streptomyces sp. XY413]